MRINPGECLPFGYGIIYYDAPRNQSVACWVPFNWVLRGLRELWYCLSIPGRSRREKAEAELKSLIRCIHKQWYSNWLDDPKTAIKLHNHISELFNYAGIEETLCRNNPEKISPTDFENMMENK